MIDIRKLRYFATVAEFGSFTRAAEFLGVAQPALSRQVQQLEQEFGLQLFLRSSRQVRLTDAGDVLLRHAHSINRDFERLIDDMRVRKGSPAGRVVVGITPTLAETLVPALAETVNQEFPRLSLKIAEAVTPVLADWVQANKVDLAVLSLAVMDDEDSYPALKLESLAMEEMIVVEKASQATSAGVYTLADLSAKRLVVSDILEKLVRNRLGLDDLGIGAYMEIDAVQAIKRIVLNGQAASILPVSVMGDEIRQGLVVGSAITDKGVHREIVLAHPHYRQMTQASEAVSGVLKSLVDHITSAGLFSLSRVVVTPNSSAVADETNSVARRPSSPAESKEPKRSIPN